HDGAADHGRLRADIRERTVRARAAGRTTAGAEERRQHAARGDRLSTAAGRPPRGDRLSHRQPAQRRGIAGGAELQPHVRLPGDGGAGLMNVIKLGGSLLDDPVRRAEALHAIAIHWKNGEEIVLVHGGGKHVDANLKRLGIPKRTYAGLRVTDDATLDVVVSTLAGSVNKMLVAELAAIGVRSAGISGCDASTLSAELHPPIDGVDLGHVGSVTGGDPTLLRAIVSYGILPVVSSVAE